MTDADTDLSIGGFSLLSGLSIPALRRVGRRTRPDSPSAPCHGPYGAVDGYEIPPSR